MVTVFALEKGQNKASPVYMIKLSPQRNGAEIPGAEGAGCRVSGIRNG